MDAAAGPGSDFIDLYAAYAAAAPGDVVLIRSGSYIGHPLAGKGLTLVADAGASVVIGGLGATGVPAGESLVLRGLTLPAVDIGQCNGHVHVEECTFGGGGLTPAALSVQQSSAVAVERCTGIGIPGTIDGPAFGMLPAGAGLAIEASLVAVHSSSFQGGLGLDGFYHLPASIPAGYGGPGCSLSAGTLYAAGSTFAGGQGGDGFFHADFFICMPPATGGAGLWLMVDTPTAELAGTQLVGGAGGGPGLNPMCTLSAPAGASGSIRAPSTCCRGRRRCSSWARPCGRGERRRDALDRARAGSARLPRPSLPRRLRAGPAARERPAAGAVAARARARFGAAQRVVSLASTVGQLGVGVESLQLFLQGAVCDAAGLHAERDERAAVARRGVLATTSGSATLEPARALSLPCAGIQLPRRVVVSGAVVLVAVTWAFVPVATDPYRRKPSPAGMVLRVAFGEVEDPLRRVLVMPAEGRRSAFWIVNPFATEDEPAVLEVELPSGESNEVVLERLPGLPAAAPFFDLNGDRVEDRISVGEGPETDRVQVHCGATGQVLFENLDPFEYATRDRAFPLGDLDGDGYGELALVHPRENRNDYDVHPGDWIFGVSSWVTVISGARLSL